MKTQPHNIAKIKKRIISILDKYFGNDYILFLFGSFAKNKIDNLSDFDLAIYSKNPIPPSKIVKVKEELETKAGTLRDIELINLTQEVDSLLLKNILEEGILWKKTKNSEELLRNLRRHLRNLKR